MLISPDNKETAYLVPLVIIVDQDGKLIQTAYSFDTVTKMAEVFMLNDKGQVKVINNKPVTVKEHKPLWRVIDRITREEIK